MTNDRTNLQQRGEPLKDTGPSFLTVGVATVLGVACCWGLPLLLDALAVGYAWLTAEFALAALHRVLLLATAAVCLAAGAVLAWRDPAASASDVGTVFSHPIVRRLTVFGLLIGGILLAIGYVYA
jgi:hypothetical protein